KINSPNYPKEKLEWNSERMVSRRVFPKGRELSVKYDNRRRVTRLKAPDGSCTRIKYEPGKTKSYDPEGSKTRYTYNQDNLRLTSIKRFQGKHKVLTCENFTWTKQGNLLSRSNEKLSHSYAYDASDNPISETLSGTITSLHSRDEHTTQRIYSQDGRNLLLSETYPSGKSITYTYLEGTDLPLTKTEPLLETQYQYNEDNLLIQEIITDGTQKRTKIIRPRQKQPFYGMPETIEHVELGRKEHLQYNEHGEVIAKQIYDSSDSLAYTLHYTYDEKGRLTSETNPIGQKASYQYDKNGNLIHETAFSGLQKTYTYDTSNRCIQETRGHQKTLHTYNTLGCLTSTTNHLGATTHYTYDALGNLLTETNPLGATTTYTYDTLGNPTAVTDPLGSTTHTSYNICGQPLQITHPDGTTETYTYTLEGKIESYRDQEGTTTHYTYDLLDRELTKTITDLSGNILLKESNIYSPFHKTSHTNALGHTTNYHYNEAGQLIVETYADKTTSYTYDSLGRKATKMAAPLTIFYTYDLLDRITSEKHFHNETLINQEETTYDAAGNIALKTRYPNNTPATKSWEYDLLDREISHKDPLGHTTTTEYAETDKLIKTLRHPDATTTIETYDPLNLLRFIEKRAADGKTLHSEAYTYDLAGNETTRSINVYHDATFDHQFRIDKNYDRLNRLTTLIENHTKTSHYTYTSKGELSTLTKPSSTTLFYTYDPLGHLTTLTSSDNTIDYTYAYNPLGQLLHSTNNLTTRSLTRTYDPHGNTLSEILPSGHTCTNTYDTLDNRTSLIHSTGHTVHYTYQGNNLTSATVRDQTTQYIWDLDQNLLSQTLPNQSIIHYTIDPLGRPISHHSPYLTQTLDEFDPMGNLLTETLNGTIKNYTYDPLSQLTSEPTASYTYDSLNNRLSKNQQPISIDAHNQITTHHCDPNGNPTQTDTHALIYDALDRPIQINGTPFTYDSEHRCENLIWDGQHELGNPISLRILGHTPHAEIGAAIAIYLSNQLHIPIHDLYGNQVILLDPQNDPIESHQYSAFGEKTTTSRTPWGYRSKRVIQNLVDFGRRLYDPTLGRFLTPDPEGYTDGPNLYAYVGNHPLTSQDPFGLMMNGNPYLKWEAEEKLIKPFKEAISTPRFSGGMQALGGLSEAGFGAGMTFASGGVAAPLGWPVMAHGLDHFFTGMGTVLTGRTRDSVTATLLQKTGMPREYANLSDGMMSVGGAMKGAAVMRGTGIFQSCNPSTTGMIASNERTLLNFTDTAGKHMYEMERRIPIHILDDVIKSPIAVVRDPQKASSAMMHYGRICRNGKLYNAEVLYDKTTNTISHFQYTQKPIGPLKKVSK
nr:tRNA3(Ser)-specific nuclease WapA [Chlamydiota bacterium]